MRKDFVWAGYVLPSPSRMLDEDETYGLRASCFIIETYNRCI